MKIGLLLGSFDPIHMAHVLMASFVINSGLCDKVLFVVAKQNPWKKNDAADFELRCKMIEASIYPFLGACEVCRLEKDIDYPTYSYKVLELIRKNHINDNLYIIGGTDTIDKVTYWKNFNDRIKPYYKFIEIARGNTENTQNDKNPFIITKKDRGELGIINCIVPKQMDISSTMVRELVKNNMNPYPYVNEQVSKIIFINKLYKN